MGSHEDLNHSMQHIPTSPQIPKFIIHIEHTSTTSTCVLGSWHVSLETCPISLENLQNCIILSPTLVKLIKAILWCCRTSSEDSWERFRAYSLVLMHMGEFWISQLHCSIIKLEVDVIHLLWDSSLAAVKMSSEIAVSGRGSHTIVTTPTQTYSCFLHLKT
jgi:hypothetical protein